MPWNSRTAQHYEKQTELLKKRVVGWVDSLKKAPAQWMGPSLYFHKVLVRAADEVTNLKIRAQSLSYVERLYACLVSWGIHRFDNPRARLVEFPQFRDQVVSAAGSLSDLADFRLEELSKKDFKLVISWLSPVVDGMKIVVADWALVVNSRLLHHLLPHLIPPIDRNYTLQYFIGRQDDSGNDPSYTFEKILRSFWTVAVLTAES